MQIQGGMAEAFQYNFAGIYSNAEAYRDLAHQAANMVAIYHTQAERFAHAGQEQIAAEYRQLADEAAARSHRYAALARLTEDDSAEPVLRGNNAYSSDFFIFGFGLTRFVIFHPVLQNRI
jgi:hypothetical protein